MTTTYGPARAGHNQGLSSIPRRQPTIYTPSTSSNTPGRIVGNAHRPQAFEDRNSNMIQYQTKGQTNPQFPPHYPPSLGLPSWSYPYGSPLVSPAPFSTHIPPMPPHPNQPCHDHGWWTSGKCQNANHNEEMLDQFTKHEPRVNPASPDRPAHTYDTTSSWVTHPGSNVNQAQNREMAKSVVSDNNDWIAQSEEQFGEPGEIDSWGWETNQTERVDTPEPAHVKSLVRDDTILINGVKYVKADTTTQKVSVTPDLQSRELPDGFALNDHSFTENPSEPYDDGKDHDADCDGHDEAYSQAGSWPKHSDDCGLHGEAPKQKDASWSDAGTENAEHHGAEADEQCDNKSARGTCENPIKISGYFDEDPIRVLVGVDTIFERRIPRSIMRRLLDQSSHPELSLAMEESRPVVFRNLSNEALEMILVCMYSGYGIFRSINVVYSFQPYELGQLYVAARYFEFHDLAYGIVDTLKEQNDLYNTFRIAKDVYAADQADCQFRDLARGSAAFLLAKIGTRESDDWSSDYATEQISDALTGPNFPELFRKDIVEIIVNHEVERNVSEKVDSLVPQIEEHVNELSEPKKSDWDGPAAGEPIYEGAQVDKLPKHYNDGEIGRVARTCSGWDGCTCEDCVCYDQDTRVQEVEEIQVKTHTEGRSDQSAVAVRDYYDHLTGFSFQTGDQVRNVALLTDLLESRGGSLEASGVCNGQFGKFPFSYIKIEEKDEIKEDQWGPEADDNAENNWNPPAKR